MKTIYSQSQDFQLAVQTYKQLGNDSNKAALEGCMLLARMNNKLLEEFDGNVQSKGYKKVASILVDATGLKKAQYCKDIAVGNYLIINIETKPELWSIAKTSIYKAYIHVSKPKPKSIKKPSNEAEFYKDILIQIKTWADNRTKTKFDGICQELGINQSVLGLD